MPCPHRRPARRRGRRPHGRPRSPRCPRTRRCYGTDVWGLVLGLRASRPRPKRRSPGAGVRCAREER
ncbi:hypothetical protein DQ384_05245 [Sphaerisporangium album]|uniref:Uncharacterized protein n=1 Tax=Sphaerisporangium album TaxID=509200 RepID=A0A367FPW8_9ACTN|nr:hypothetical protein DQ384_05245 [Sphaerisporangium album]